MLTSDWLAGGGGGGGAGRVRGESGGREQGGGHGGRRDAGDCAAGQAEHDEGARVAHQVLLEQGGQGREALRFCYL